MITRTLANYAITIAQKYPVLTITGPRQSGKTTLARTCFPDKPYANLEHPQIRQFALDDPVGFLAQYPDGAILDEVQRGSPDLLSCLQVLVDEKKKNGLFLLTGSQQFGLMDRISQSLAGRTALLKLLPFSLEEAGQYPPVTLDGLLHKGFYPRIYDQDIPPARALADYYETYIERDLRQLVNVRDLGGFQRFVQLCAGRCGQLLNYNNLAADAGISHSTAREWLKALEASYILFLLPPYHANIGKRLNKSPKLYFHDVGLAAWLCGIEEVSQVASHPLRGNFFENLVVAEAVKFRYNLGRRANLFFYRDSSGREIDLLYPLGNTLLPVEIKAGQTVGKDWFKTLEYFQNLFPDRTANRSAIIYGGEARQDRSRTSVLNVFSFPAFLREQENSEFGQLSNSHEAEP